VMRPAKTKDLYFVADGTGGHVFAASLDEHNRNVFKWRKVERELRAKEAQEAAAKAAQEAAGGGALDAAAPQAAPAGSAGAAPQGAGAPVAKTVPGAFAADPSLNSGSFDDPSALTIPSQDPFAVPAEAAPAGAAEDGTAASGESVPKPKRNPKR
jgi:peptidoglycan lytic transglycosylase G